MSSTTTERDLHDLHCVRCGYALRGLAGDARCPECGTSVETSRHDLLRHADRVWLASLYRGMNLGRYGLWAFFATLVAFFCVVFMGLGVLYINALDAVEAALSAMLEVIRYLFIAAFVVMGVGVWMMSAPEPRDIERESPELPFRVLSGLAVPAFGLWLYLAHMQALGSVHWSLQQLAVHVLYAATMGHAALLSRFTCRLERRLPAHRTRMFQPINWRPTRFLIMAGGLLALYWIGPVFFAPGPPNRPFQPPGEQAQALLAFATIVVWLSILSSVLQLRPLVQKEATAVGAR